MFEKFNIPPPEQSTERHSVVVGATTSSSSSSRNNGSSSSRATAPVAAAPRSLSTSEGDNNFLPTATPDGEEEAQEVAKQRNEVGEEDVELRRSSSTKTTTRAVIMNNNDSETTLDTRSSILPYPRGVDVREDLLADWANSVMRECEELVIEPPPAEVRLSSSPGPIILPGEWGSLDRIGGTAHSYAGHDAARHLKTLMTKTKPPLVTRPAAAEGVKKSDARGRRSGSSSRVTPSTNGERQVSLAVSGGVEEA